MIENERLGCLAQELRPGDEFSVDEGRTWAVCITVADAPEDESSDVIINGRLDDGDVETFRLTYMKRVLLDRHHYGRIT